VQQAKANHGVKGFDGIVKELSLIIDPRQSGADEKVIAENLMPNSLYLLYFGEKAMASHIEVEAFIVVGPGKATDLVGFLQNDRSETLLDKLIGSSQAGWATADDDDATIFH
jgi:hypothetical protein